MQPAFALARPGTIVAPAPLAGAVLRPVAAAAAETRARFRWGALAAAAASSALVATFAARERRSRHTGRSTAARADRAGGLIGGLADLGRRERLLEKRVKVKEQRLTLEKEAAAETERRLAEQRRKLDSALNEERAMSQALKLQISALQESCAVLKELLGTSEGGGVVKENTQLSSKLEEMEQKLTQVQAEAVARAVEAARDEALRAVGLSSRSGGEEDVAVRAAVEAVLREVEETKAVEAASNKATRAWMPHVFVDFSGGISRW